VEKLPTTATSRRALCLICRAPDVSGLCETCYADLAAYLRRPYDRRWADVDDTPAVRASGDRGPLFVEGRRALAHAYARSARHTGSRKGGPRP
jgi:hypothetical protein